MSAEATPRAAIDGTDGRRALQTAELLAIGTELTVGETVDTNSRDIARWLTALGVEVQRVTSVPDTLDVVIAAFRDGLAAADLVVSTGGLGPTPDDLTREAIAALCGETPAVDPELLGWLRGLWDRRGMPFPDANVKQAWLIPSATAIPNPNGTAPGWLVERPDGGLIVALPGPPAEMRPMWSEHVEPRLRDGGAGRGLEVRTLRLAGIGESVVADRLGDALLRASNPIVATYARVDAVDVRIAARAEPQVAGSRGEGAGGTARSAVQVADDAERVVTAALGDHVWARGTTTWAEAIDEELARHGWTLTIAETGTGGATVSLIGSMDRLTSGTATGNSVAAPAASDDELATQARRLRRGDERSVGLVVRAEHVGGDTIVRTAVATATGEHVEQRVAFLGGTQGRTRAALAAAHVLLLALRDRG
ncbi:MAG: competence/damage-inducible protein A [Chloroflexota bacterium]